MNKWIRKNCQKTCKVGGICKGKIIDPLGTNSFLLKLNLQANIESNLGFFYKI